MSIEDFARKEVEARKTAEKEERMVKEAEELFAPRGGAITSIEGLAKEVKGKRCVIYGESWTGKTTLALHMAKHLGKVLFIDADTNYPVQEMVKRLGLDLIYKQAKSFEQTYHFLRSTTADTVIIDSLSGLVSNLIDRLGIGNPRLALLNAQYQERLIKLCMHFGTSIIITHLGADFRRGERIRINQALLRYIDLIIKLDRDIEGKRFIEVQRRIPIESPSFEFRGVM